jgi:hypothetical protein
MLALAAVIVVALTARADEDVLANLRRGHPRLLALDSDVENARSAIATNAVAKSYYKNLKDVADKWLDQPPVEHKLIGPRLLQQSRTALVRISTWGFLYRLNHEQKYADRAKKELLTIVAFKDWNPSHFLDVAEMTNAAAIGYDWFYDELSPEERSTIKRGIVELGLKPGIDAYTKKKPSWTKASHNWAQVCAGGLVVGALAVADEEPDLARQLIPLTREAIARAMKTFAPDGGWPEGPGYWHYATQYNVYYLAALKTALGTDLGLKSFPGFSETANFRIASIGPIGKSFNFADAGEGVSPASQMYWLSREFNRPEFAAAERFAFPKAGDAFALLWFDPRGTTDNIPRDSFFKGVNVAFFRSASGDPKAWFIGFKGGDNKANHSHLDLGTFVLDALGQRFACDLGPDDYNLPAYFGKNRFTYYRLRTEAHNTLTLNNENQPQPAKAPIIAYDSKPDRAFAVADLSNAYPDATSAQRGVAMLNRNSVLIQDEFAGEKELPVIWSMLTQAEVKLSDDGATATLKRGDATIEAHLLERKGAKFQTMQPKVDPPQAPLKGVTKLFIKPDPAKQLRIAVLFSAKDAKRNAKIEPLEKWVISASEK